MEKMTACPVSEKPEEAVIPVPYTRTDGGGVTQEDIYPLAEFLPA